MKQGDEKKDLTDELTRIEDQLEDIEGKLLTAEADKRQRLEKEQAKLRTSRKGILAKLANMAKPSVGKSATVTILAERELTEAQVNKGKRKSSLR